MKNLTFTFFIFIAVVSTQAHATPRECTEAEKAHAARENQAILADPAKMQTLRNMFPQATIDRMFQMAPRCYTPDVPTVQKPTSPKHVEEVPSCLTGEANASDKEILERANQCLISIVGKEYFYLNYTRVPKVSPEIHPEQQYCYYLVDYHYWPVQKLSPGNRDFFVAVPQNLQARCGSATSVIRGGRIIEPTVHLEQALRVAYDAVRKYDPAANIPSFEDILNKKSTATFKAKYYGSIAVETSPSPYNDGERWEWVVNFDWWSSDKPNCKSGYLSIVVNAETGVYMVTQSKPQIKTVCPEPINKDQH